MRGLGGSGDTSRVKAAVVDIVSALGGGAAAAGTGIVLTSSGVVLTNDHVVVGAEAISVRLTSTGRTYPATLINADQYHDVAVLQLQGAAGLTAAPLGDSATVRVGDSVTAWGNALGREGPPVEAPGRVTALGQSITASDETGQTSENLTDMIQTDAPIQPGTPAARWSTATARSSAWTPPQVVCAADTIPAPFRPSRSQSIPPSPTHTS